MPSVKVKLGDAEYAVPEFVVRDIKKFLPKMMAAGRIDYRNMTEEDLDLVFDVVFTGISRPDPDEKDAQAPPITREQFDGLPIKLDQLMRAIPVIAEQAGMRPKGAAADGTAGPSPGTTS